MTEEKTQIADGAASELNAELGALQPQAQTAKYFKACDMEATLLKNRYTFFCEIYDEHKKYIPNHPLADRYMWAKPWRTISSMMNKAIKRCEKAGLVRIY